MTSSLATPPGFLIGLLTELQRGGNHICTELKVCVCVCLYVCVCGLTCVLGSEAAPWLQFGEGGLHRARGEADISVDDGESLNRWRDRGDTGLLHRGQVGGAVGGQGAPHRPWEGGGAVRAGHMVRDGGRGLEGGEGLPGGEWGHGGGG